MASRSRRLCEPKRNLDLMLHELISLGFVGNQGLEPAFNLANRKIAGWLTCCSGETLLRSTGWIDQTSLNRLFQNGPNPPKVESPKRHPKKLKRVHSFEGGPLRFSLPSLPPADPKPATLGAPGGEAVEGGLLLQRLKLADGCGPLDALSRWPAKPRTRS